MVLTKVSGPKRDAVTWNCGGSPIADGMSRTRRQMLLR